MSSLVSLLLLNLVALLWRDLISPRQLMFNPLPLFGRRVLEPVLEVDTLCAEPGVVIQAVDPPQELLEVPQRRAGLVARNLVAGHEDGGEGQAPVLGPFAEGAVAGLRHDALRVVRHHQVVVQRFREPLGPVPREVLQRQQRPVDHEHHVERAVADDDVVGALDHRGQRPAVVGGRRGPVDSVGEDARPRAADRPVVRPVGAAVCGRVDGLLHVGAREVRLGGSWRVFVVRVAYDVAWVLAWLADVVDVETWVELVDVCTKIHTQEREISVPIPIPISNIKHQIPRIER